MLDLTVVILSNEDLVGRWSRCGVEVQHVSSTHVVQGDSEPQINYICQQMRTWGDGQATVPIQIQADVDLEF